ncbi:NmrA/HSCARG family protein [Aspergillus novofumigatus IBT 16806]|uniref:NmrA-like family protein n=1 Tax=Aspergillus novofumigatus (strain IBT 16806) TaxID=1392255 RepID=A0A2I1CPM0_ASPN1|nr:NmrA-like family protein [Aspergillus novofumigatus IBT 16806]PKX99566.1 NmrA-like family protein [Aspergillus novofumigatus IBT 16806]
MLQSILVTGATGKQGGAVIKALTALQDARFSIFALTRDVDSARSKGLLKHYPSIKLISGDLNDPDAIFGRIGLPVWGVFSVQTPYGKDASLDLEVAQGKSLVDAALRNHVKFFVYSSVDRGGPRSDDGACPVPHFETKRQIEDHLRLKTVNANMQYTILRPTFFMDNITNDLQGGLVSAAWKANVDPKRVQLIATSDIGLVAAQAFAKPYEYAGRAISLAGDELTHEEAALVWQEETGSPMPIGSRILAWALLRAVKDLRFMFKWFREEGYGANIPELKSQYPELQDLRTWVRSNKRQ